MSYMLKKASKNLKGKIYLTKEELEKIKKIEHSNFEIRFYSQQIKYKKPRLTYNETLNKSKTYCIKAYIPIKIRYKKLEVFPCDRKKKLNNKIFFLQ